MAREIYPNSLNKSLKIAPLFSMQKELRRMFDDFYGVEILREFPLLHHD